MKTGKEIPMAGIKLHLMKYSYRYENYIFEVANHDYWSRLLSAARDRDIDELIEYVTKNDIAHVYKIETINEV